MLRLFIISSLLLLSQSLLSQDTIVFRSGERIGSKIIEVTTKEIVYKKQADLNGPVYRVDIYDIHKIKLQNGTVEEFNPLKGDSWLLNLLGVEKHDTSSLGKNIIAINLSEIKSNASVSYERVFGKRQRLGLKLPVSIRMTGSAEFDNNVYTGPYYSGLELNYYPQGQGKFNYLVGPSLRFGSASFLYRLYSDALHFQTLKQKTSFITMNAHAGISYTPVKEINVSLVMYLGTGRYFYSGNTFSDFGLTTATLDLRVGYRF